jgi:uncharacterized membrane protein YsdA (DUF1294 family)
VNKKRIDKHFKIGLTIILIDTYWIWDNLYLLYQYNYTGILWLFMYPEWTLILNSILGILGMIIGIGLIRHKLKIKKGIISTVLLIILGKLIQFLTVI